MMWHKACFVCMLTLALLNCAGGDEGCSSDYDCREGRVCSSGDCRDVENKTPPTTPPAVDNKLQCGVVAINCNCTTTAYLSGQLGRMNSCESGTALFEACAVCVNGATAWQAICAC